MTFTDACTLHEDEDTDSLSPRLREQIQTWIDAVVSFPRGQCEGYSKTLVGTFPCLEVRKGFYFAWGRKNTHWWCRHRKTGEIVDPTARQFPAGEAFPTGELYEDLTDLTDAQLLEVVPTGVCMGCGKDTYRYERFCSPWCANRTLDEVNESLQQETLRFVQKPFRYSTYPWPNEPA